MGRYLARGSKKRELEISVLTFFTSGHEKSDVGWSLRVVVFNPKYVLCTLSA